MPRAPRRAQRLRAVQRKKVAKVKAARRKRLATLRPRRIARTSQLVGRVGGITSSFVSVRHPRGKTGAKLTRFGAPCRSLVHTPGQLLGDPGTQVTALLGQWFSVQDIYNISITGVPSESGYLGSALPTHFNMKSIYSEITLVNPSSLPMIYDIYDVVARKDIPNGTTLPSPNLDVTNPIGAWHTGLLVQSLTPQGTSISGTEQYENQIGCRPVDSQLFNDYFRVLKHTSVVVPQVGTHVHKVSIQSNKVFDKNELTLMNIYLNGIANVTQYTLCVCRGSVGMNTYQSGTATTTLQPMVRWTSMERYTYSYLQASGSTWQFKDTVTKPSVADTVSINLNNASTGVPTSF